MKWHPSKIIAPTKIYGGKSYLARRHLALVPPGIYRFAELYGGTGVVSLNAPTFEEQLFSDADPIKVAVMVAIKTQLTDLTTRLKKIPYGEKSFQLHKERNIAHAVLPQACSCIDLAVSAIVRCRMSRSAQGKEFGWSDRLRRNRPEYISAWESMIDSLPTIHRRLKTILLNCGSAVSDYDFLWQDPGTFLYLDPPYLKADRVAKEAYGDWEVDMEHHHTLLARCYFAKAKIMLCTYRNSIYDEALKGWRVIDFDVPSCSGQGKTKKRKVDSIYLNY